MIGDDKETIMGCRLEENDDWGEGSRVGWGVEGDGNVHK